MSYYQVNATLHVPAWVTVEAETPREALDEAARFSASLFDYDMSSASINFDTDPVVEPAQ